MKDKNVRIIKHEKPDYVLKFDRPVGTEIKCINGNWYLYECKSVYDKETKKKRKVSGPMLGSIKPEGFVPKKIRVDDAELSGAQIQEYGFSSFLYHQNLDILEKLKQYFPFTWQKIFALAVMRCKNINTLNAVDVMYEKTWISSILGKMSLSPGTLSKDLRVLGRERGQTVSYMRDNLSGFSGYLLIDGHRIITGSKNMPLAQYGYDSRLRYSRQHNLLYLFGSRQDSRMPLYYKRFAGSVPDCTALPELSRESGISGADITVIADKGFSSGEDFNDIIDSGMKYIIPLRRNTREAESLPPSYWGDFTDIFNYDKRPVCFKQYRKEGYNIFLYYDMKLASEEAGSIVERLTALNNDRAAKVSSEDKRRSKGRGRLTDEELADLKPIDTAELIQNKHGIGTLIIRTNRTDLNGAQVYCLYKTRQQIEQSFKCYDDTLDQDSSYMQDPDAFEGWLFINHIALQMLFRVLDTLAQLELSSQYSFDKVRLYLSSIEIYRVGNKWYLSKYAGKVKKLCENLRFNVLPPEDIRVP